MLVRHLLRKTSDIRERFCINIVDYITVACIVLELMLLFAISLGLLAKSWISQKKKWSSFSTFVLMGHLLSSVFSVEPVIFPG